MGQAIAFYTISAFVLFFAVLVVSTKDTVHSVLFLVVDFLFVAALYVLLGAEFLAAIQVLVYAGGIVVLYLFVVMLVNLKRPPEAYEDPHRRTKVGYALSAAVLVELGAIVGYGYLTPPVEQTGPCCLARVRQHRAGGLAPVHELSDSVRDRVDTPAGRDDRRDRAGETRTMKLSAFSYQPPALRADSRELKAT